MTAGCYCFFQYGKEYEFDAPVKLLDKHLHAMAQSIDEQVVVVSQVSPSILRFNCFLVHPTFRAHLCSEFLQVLVADINIGYEDIVNTQVSIYIA